MIVLMMRNSSPAHVKTQAKETSALDSDIDQIDHILINEALLLNG